MKQRIASILCCTLLLLTLAAGAHAANPFSVYAQYGLTWEDESGDLYYEGRPVRIFENFDATGHGGYYASHDGGEVDVHKEFDAAGTCVGLKAYDAEAFAVRTALWQDIISQAGAAAAATQNGDQAMAQDVLNRYLLYWRQRDYDALVVCTTPSWRMAQQVPAQQLYWNHNWWELDSWSIQPLDIGPDWATFTVVADLHKSNSSQTPATMEYSALLMKENSEWYVDPDSMRTGIAIDKPAAELVPAALVSGTVQTKEATPYDAYLPYGLRYEPATGNLFFGRERVRHLHDVLWSNGEQMDSDTFRGAVYSHRDPDGTVDLHTVRDSAGNLTDIRVSE